jgi:hypothetical protein
VVYFLDYIVGSAWWIIVLHLVLMFAVFVIRGHPYSGRNIVAVLFPTENENGSGSSVCDCVSKAVGTALACIWTVVSKQHGRTV